MAQQITDGEISYLAPEDLVARWRGQVSLRTLSRWRGKGTGPAFIRVAGRPLYPLDGVIEYERSRFAPGQN